MCIIALGRGWASDKYDNKMHITTLWQKHFVCRNKNLDITGNLKFEKKERKILNYPHNLKCVSDIVVPNNYQTTNSELFNFTVNISNG